jgi:hypothetical protein
MLSLAERQLPAQNALLAANDRDITAHSGSVKIHVAKGAAAFIVNRGTNLCVLALHDDGARDITVTVAGKDIQLRTGQQLVVSAEDNSNFKDALLMPEVATRYEGQHVAANGLHLFVSDFSLPSAMRHITTLSALTRSDVAQERALYKKMLKNAAILQMVTGRKGVYKAYAAPKSENRRMALVSSSN